MTHENFNSVYRMEYFYPPFIDKISGKSPIVDQRLLTRLLTETLKKSDPFEPADTKLSILWANPNVTIYWAFALKSFKKLLKT